MTETKQRSTFVTVVAWIFIALSGVGTLTSALLAVVVQFVFPAEVDRLLQTVLAQFPDPPPAFTFMISYFRLFFLASLLTSALTLISSIGLLRRWNWARLCFIGIMLLGIVWNLAGPVIQIFVIQYMQQLLPQINAIPKEALDTMDFKASMIQSVATSVISAIGFSVLYGWIVKRLLSAPIAAEFRRSPEKP